jgi:hypothetical protein
MSHVEDEDVDDFLYGDSGAVKNEAQDATDNQMESGRCMPSIIARSIQIAIFIFNNLHGSIYCRQNQRTKRRRGRRIIWFISRRRR